MKKLLKYHSPRRFSPTLHFFQAVRIYLVFLLAVFQNSNARAPDAHLQGGHDREWNVYSGGPESIRYTKLTQINRDNVNRLQVAWTFDSGDSFPASENECNPIVVNGVLYATTPKINVVALDAATGRLLWRFDPNVGMRVVGKMRSRGRRRTQKASVLDPLVSTLVRILAPCGQKFVRQLAQESFPQSRRISCESAAEIA